MKNQGFSLIEFIIALAIAAVVLIGVSAFARNIFVHNLSSQASLTAQLESRKILGQMVGELRSLSQSAVGSYAIESAATSSIIFFADVNGDDDADRIRYFLDPNLREVRRGVVLAAGSPATYNLGSETVSTLTRDVLNGTTPLLDYYNGSGVLLSLPINLAQVRMIKVTTLINKNINKVQQTFTFTSSATLRNLKDNL